MTTHLSAISEAMNQMMGSAATSLSSMLDKTIDISPPEANLIDMTDSLDEREIDEFLTGNFVRISFKMEIGDLVDSTIMQLYPISFAKEMCESITKNMTKDMQETPAPAAASGVSTPTQAEPAPQPAQAAQPAMGQPMMGQMGQPMMGQMGQPMMMQQPMMGQPVNVQQAQFQSFSGDFNPAIFQKENID